MSSGLRFSVLCTALMLSASPPAHAADDKWSPWVDAEAKLGNNRSLGILDAFAPVWQDADSLVFFNPRFRLDDQDSREYNLGFGYRELKRDWVLGLYGFADRNRSPSGNYFHQVTLGGEAMGTDYKFRLNHYQPFGDRNQLGHSPTVIATGGTLMISGGIESSLQGNDIEAGYRIPIGGAEDASQLWVYGGAYRFDSSDTKAIAGPRARVEYNIGGMTLADRDVRLRLSGEIQHDSVRDTNWFTGIRIGIPFGAPSRSAAKLTPLERHMADPVERDVDVVVGESLEHAINPLSGGTIGSVYTLYAGGNLQAIIDAAGDNAVFVFDGSNGDFTDSGSDPMTVMPFVMHDGQIFTSAGGSVLLRGADSGATAAYHAGGTAATFSGIEGIQLASDNAISGLTFENMPGQVIFGTDPGNVSITHNTFSGNTSISESPIELSSSTAFTATIDHNSFTNNTNGAVAIAMQTGVTSADIAFTNNIATNNGSGSQGILGSAFTLINTGNIGATTLTMTGNTMTGNDKYAFYTDTGGVFSSFTGLFADNDFSNNAGGITYGTNTTNASLTITGNTISGNSDNAIGIVAANITNLDLVVDGNQINGSTNHSNGIAIASVSGQMNLEITNNSISNNEGSAILYYDGDATVPDITAVISHNIIQGNQNLDSNAAGGIAIDGFDSLDLTMDSNTFSNNAGGIALGTLGGTAPTGATNVTFTNNSQTSGDALTMQFNGNGSACATISGNTSTTGTAYNLTNAAAGTFTLTPANYAAVNTGGFNTTGAIATAASCP